MKHLKYLKHAAVYAVLSALCCSPACIETLSGAEPTSGVTAHRGGSTQCPENTLSAFRDAIALGVDWIETDVYRTKDGRLVLIHDRSTLRTAGVDVDVNRATYDELAKIDVAAVFRKSRGRTIEEVPFESVPLLEDALDLVLNAKKTRLSLQPKDDCVDACIAMIRAKNAVARVGFNDGNLAKMSRVKELEPTVPVFWDRHVGDNLDQTIRIAREKGFEAICPNYTDMTAEKAKRIHDAGFVPGVWTVNGDKLLRTMLRYGVERIYTDDPALLVRIKSETGK